MLKILINYYFRISENKMRKTLSQEKIQDSYELEKEIFITFHYFSQIKSYF